jgi:hypothetical protein
VPSGRLRGQADRFTGLKQLDGSHRLWVPGIAIVAVLLCGPLAYFATASTADAVLDQYQSGLQPCPSVPTSIHPSVIHFEPGLLEHQNWLEFPVPKRFAGVYMFCLDGRMLESGGGVLDFSSGSARFHIATRSVDLYWLRGDLDSLRDPNRWDLRLVCTTNGLCSPPSG